MFFFVIATSLAGLSSVQKQIVLDGPVSCGKSIALAMLVNWARDEGWLVFYVPEGRSWTHGGLFYKNPETGLWDTPVQAANILQARIPSYKFQVWSWFFLKFNIFAIITLLLNHLYFV